MTAGRFVVFEGVDGVGKTTLRRLLHDRIVAHGHRCFIVGQHSWLEVSAARILIDSREHRRVPNPTILRNASIQDKVIHSRENITPMLHLGWVIADRYIWSDAAYHEALYGIRAEDTLETYHSNNVAVPDLTLYITADVNDADMRIRGRSKQPRHYERPAILEQVQAVYERIRKQWIGRVLEYRNEQPLDPVRFDVSVGRVVVGSTSIFN